MNPEDKLLTKAELLEGKNRREKFYIPKLNGSLEIRPLTELEWTKVQAVNSGGMKFVRKKDEKGNLLPEYDIDFDAEKSAESTFKAYQMVVSYGVCNLELSLDDVEKFEAGIIPDLAEAIMELTGVSFTPKFRLKAKKDNPEQEDKTEKVRQFRQNS